MPEDSRHKAFDEKKNQWDRIRHAYDGTDAVKEAGTRYLPALSSDQLSTTEGKIAYDAYKLRALWYNAPARTVDGLAGTVMQKAPTVENVSADVETDLRDVTMTGESLDGFALMQVRENLLLGRCGILVDVSQEGEDRRPYWVGYHSESIINWRQERVDGKMILTRVVLSEQVSIDDDLDPYVTIETDQIRCLHLDDDGLYVQQRFQKKEGDDDWSMVDEVEPQRRGERIPFLPFVLAPIVKPPLLDLVDVAYSWYRSSADREHALFWVSVPTPWVRGVPGDSVLRMGGDVAWVLGDNGAAGMLEHSGAGIEAISTNMAEKRDLMATLGARLLEGQPSTQETAKAVSMRHAGEYATLRTIASTSSRELTQALKFHEWFRGTEANPRDYECEIALNRDFENIRATPEEIKTNLLLWQSAAITFETFYHNLKIGEWTRPGVDFEAEKVEISREDIDNPATVNEGDDDAEYPS